MNDERWHETDTKETIFKIGDQVMLSAGMRKKLSSRWLGPFVITSLHNIVNATIANERFSKVVHVNRLKRFVAPLVDEPAQTNDLPTQRNVRSNDLPTQRNVQSNNLPTQRNVRSNDLPTQRNVQ